MLEILLMIKWKIKMPLIIFHNKVFIKEVNTLEIFEMIIYKEKEY